MKRVGKLKHQGDVWDSFGGLFAAAVGFMVRKNRSGRKSHVRLWLSLMVHAGSRVQFLAHF